MGGQQAGIDQGEAVLAQAVAAYRAALGSRLVAAYALGSLAHGGFSPLVSDVDLGLILRDPVWNKHRLAIHTVARAVRADGSELHRRLSVFWGTPATLAGRARGGRFPPLDRLDLLDYGRLLTGQDTRYGMARPGPEELLVAGAEFALATLGGAGNLSGRLRAWARPGSRDRDALAEIRNPARLISRGPRRTTKIVLFPVRFLFTAATGRVGTNPLAAEHYLGSAGAPAAELIAAALAWRLEPPTDEAAATALLGRELIPLYTYYLDDHITRLSVAGRRGLAESFRRWRARLLA
jgi:predicted nucleotidyltransferase